MGLREEVWRWIPSGFFALHHRPMGRHLIAGDASRRGLGSIAKFNKWKIRDEGLKVNEQKDSGEWTVAVQSSSGRWPASKFYACAIQRTTGR